MTATTAASSTDRSQPLDLPHLSAELERILKLRNPPFGMKMFENAAEMEAIPRIRRPKNVHTLDQLVGQTSRLEIGRAHV